MIRNSILNYWYKEKKMFEVTEKASEKIKELTKDKEAAAVIRVALMQGGWAGPSLGLALDESKNDDEVFNQMDLTFVMEKTFYEEIKPVKIDFIESAMGAGFNISSNMKKPESSCGGGTCSC